MKYVEERVNLASLLKRLALTSGTFFTGRHFISVRLVSEGYDVIVSNPNYVYMGYAAEVDAAERGYYWATRRNSGYS
ncbi:hypothetical protein O9929_04460 [Vibrio lentus]|nr:hypothetical protein [Vibrio lentus]